MTETDPAQRFALGTRSTLKAINFFGPVSHQSFHPNGPFDHRLGEAWNYNSPTHPPQLYGGVSSPPFSLAPRPHGLYSWGPSLQSHIPTGLLQPVLCPASAVLIGEGYETTCVPSLHFLLFNSRQRDLQHITHPHDKSQEKRGLQVRYHSLSCA